MQALDAVCEPRTADVDECPTGRVTADNRCRGARLSLPKPVCPDRQSVDIFAGKWRREPAHYFHINRAVAQSGRNPLID